VLATFGLILFFNQMVILLVGRQRFRRPAPMLSGAVPVGAGIAYPIYRLVILAVGIAVAVGLYLLMRARVWGCWSGGATHRDIVRALGVDIRMLYTVGFGLGASLPDWRLMAGPRSPYRSAWASRS
jgi:branched-chain amino acid transport system permease protein